uniref:Uncharacterized protein n=1 Tax=Triticum urartu TaxID=4572 RepID=A0A8R7TVA4_TRIUA
MHRISGDQRRISARAAAKGWSGGGEGMKSGGGRMRADSGVCFSLKGTRPRSWVRREVRRVGADVGLGPEGFSWFIAAEREVGAGTKKDRVRWDEN